MSVVVEVANQWHVEPEIIEPLTDFRHGARGLVVIDGDAHNLRSCLKQLRDLLRGRGWVGRVRVGH